MRGPRLAGAGAAPQDGDCALKGGERRSGSGAVVDAPEQDAAQCEVVRRKSCVSWNGENWPRWISCASAAIYLCGFKDDPSTDLALASPAGSPTCTCIFVRFNALNSAQEERRSGATSELLLNLTPVV